MSRHHKRLIRAIRDIKQEDKGAMVWTVRVPRYNIRCVAWLASEPRPNGNGGFTIGGMDTCA